MNAEKIAEQYQGMSKYFLFEDNELTLIEDYDDNHVYNEDTYGPTYVDPDCYYEEADAIKEVQVRCRRLLARLFLLVDFKVDDDIGGDRFLAHLFMFGVGEDRLLARLFLLVDFKEDDDIGGDRFLAHLSMLVDFEEDDVIGGNQLLARSFFYDDDQFELCNVLGVVF
nr:hypothetical protein [Tanacetum cinerariifolium]